MKIDTEYVQCRVCGTATDMTGTKLCNRCYELETRIERDLELAKRIVRDVGLRKAKSA